MKRVYLYVIALLFIAGGAEASQITVQSGQSAKYTEDALGGVDALFVAPPNSAGFSVNYFDQFSVDETLKLVNIPNYDDQTGAPISSAMTVVIIANQINLSAAIDIVGPATDVVFLTNTTGGSLTCNNCVINNALRLTLASAQASGLSNTSTALNTLSASGFLSVNNLDAPGVIALDVIAKTIDAKGSIDINSNAMSSSAGGYSGIAHGSEVVGTGSIELAVGVLAWNYENGQIASIAESDNSHTFGASFYAPRIQITTSGDLLFTGEANTLVDVIAAISYKSQAHIPDEGIVLQTLSKDNEMILSGRLVTQNSASMRALGESSVTISRYALIDAGSVEVLAGGGFVNASSIQAVNITIAAEKVANEGDLIASNQVEVWAVNDLANQYGGLIQGKDVILESKNKVVRNGSRTPYRSLSTEIGNFLNLDASEILNDFIDNLKENPNAESLFHNSSELGAFYLIPGNVVVSDALAQSVTSAADHSAHINGGTVSIRARAFENINPYYQIVTNQNNILLDRQRTNQVSITAETQLHISGPTNPANPSSETRADYVLNASALLVLNSPNGLFKIKSHKFVNQRYRVVTLLASSSGSSTSQDEYGYSTTTTNYKHLGAVTRLYSPPGFVAVMGKGEFDLQEYLANILGYVEIFGGADISTPTLVNFGLQTEYLSKANSTTSNIFNDSVGTSSSMVGHNPNDLDSLFHVTGVLRAEDTSMWAESLNVYDYFVGQVVENIASNYSEYNRTSTVTCSCGDGTATNFDERSYTLTKSDSVITVKWNTKVGSVAGGDDSGNLGNSGTDTYTVWGGLLNYLQTVSTKFMELYNEFDWWGLAA